MLKNLITVACVVLIALDTHGQVLKRNEVDKYTKKHVKETDRVGLYKGFSTALTLYANKTDSSTYLVFGMSSPSIFFTSEGSSAYVLLDDENSVELVCSQGEVASGNHIGSMTLYVAKAVYRLDQQQIEALRGRNVKAIKIILNSNKYMEFDIKPKNSSKLKNCLDLVTG